MKSEHIQNYILKNKRNFWIAAAVGDAWPEARQQVVADFLRRLETRLKRRLKGWVCEQYGGQLFVGAYPGFWIGKATWNRYAVGFQANEYGAKVMIGISRSTDNTRELPLHAPLLSAVQRIHPGAKAHAWWEAAIPMQSPAADWRTPDVLWRMKREDKFVIQVADQIVEIAEAAAKIIDGLERKK